MRVSRLGTKQSWKFMGMLLLLVVSVASLASAASYKATVLTADQSGIAPNTDPNMVNPWGISYSPTGDFWFSDNATGLSTLYNSTGVPQSLVVTIPPPTGSTATSAPTGTVFNGTTGFVVTSGGKSGAASFLFDTEDGTISGWSASVNINAAILAVDNSASGAIYKGMELATNGTSTFLYVTNFFAAKVEVYDNHYNPVTLSGSFTDPHLPSGFAPYNIRNIGGQLFVTFAKQDADKKDSKSGPGLGLVDIFDLNGNFVKRFASQGKLNAPWGLAQAPSNFGKFSSMILVGNFGDGHITAYDPSTGAAKGQLSTSAGTPIAIPGLWAIMFGNGGQGGSTNLLYFTAGPAGETHGRFGSIQAH